MASSVDPAEGRVPGGYSVIRELGVGRFGRAVLCRDTANREIVVRISGIAGERAAALEAELRTVAAAASHPCAVAIPKVWSDPELGVCFEQAYCPGVAAGPVDAEALAVGGVRLTAALAHAHRLGLLDGDLRPDDVMLDADGNWLLADAGVLDAVRRARPELAVDRDSLFSPRELRGWEPPAESADVYSLGATLRALLGDSPVEVGMDALLGRMLAPNPADRPALVEVDEVLRAEVPSAAQAALPPPPAGPRPAPPPPRPAIRVASVASVAAAAGSRRRMLAVAGAIGAVFVVAAGGVAVANSGGNHGSATAAAATASLAPSASPTAGVASAEATLTPYIDALKIGPNAKGSTDFRLFVTYEMPGMPSQVHQWQVFAINPQTKASTPQGYAPAQFPTSASPKGPRGGWQYTYRLKAGTPFNSCVQVRTDTYATATAPAVGYPSRQACASAAGVKQADKALAAAKAAAAKQAKAKKAGAKKG